MPATARRALDSTLFLFAATTLIWGSTWHVILYQIGEVVPTVAVAWRFALAALVLAALARLRGQSLALAPRWHGALAVTGTLQYGANYLCVYEAERHVPTGLVAVLFSLMVFSNAAGGRWLLGRRVTRRFLGTGALGVAGVALVFWPELRRAGDATRGGLGLALGLLAVAAASIGNTLTLMLSRRGLPLVPMLAWCMGYGALVLAVAALVQGAGLGPGRSIAWWASLAYLAALGTVAAFLMYFRLAQRLGPAQAALVGVLTPPIALVVSAAFEGWRPDPLPLAGAALALLGVLLATRPGAQAPRG